MSTSTPSTTARPTPTRGVAEYATAAGSALAVLAGVWWWVAPAAYPLTAPDDTSLIAGPWSGGKSVALIVFGALGLLTALLTARGAGAAPYAPAPAASCSKTPGRSSSCRPSTRRPTGTH